MKKIILASNSPRRKQLLTEAGIEFETVSPSDEENILNKPFSYDLVEKTAMQKCLSVKSQVTEPAVIISADTVVIIDNIITGKPKDFDEAFGMLKKLRGITHKVVTAVCIADTQSNRTSVKSETSEVTFKPLNDEQIKNYIYNFKPYDKAGAYGIQELSEDFISEIKGDYNNIVGLPVSLLKSMLKEIN